MIEGPRSERARAAEATRAATLRDWAKETAERAQLRARSSPTPGRRGNREKELFALRAQYVKTLFRTIEGMVSAVNKEAGAPLLVIEKTLNPKNLGGIEVPDGARLVIKFLERRLEVVVSPLVNIGGRRSGRADSQRLGDPVRTGRPGGTTGTICRVARDGGWQRKLTEGEPPHPPLGEREYRGLVEWLVG